MQREKAGCHFSPFPLQTPWEPPSTWTPSPLLCLLLFSHRHGNQRAAGVSTPGKGRSTGRNHSASPKPWQSNYYISHELRDAAGNCTFRGGGARKCRALISQMYLCFSHFVLLLYPPGSRWKCPRAYFISIAHYAAFQIADWLNRGG